MKNVIVIALFFCSSVHATVTGEEYEKNKNEKYMENYILGVMEGIYISSVMNSAANIPSLFCVPDDEVVNREGFLQLFETKYKNTDKKFRKIAPIEAIAFAAIQKQYPCK